MDTSNTDWVSHKDYLNSCDYDDLLNLREFLEERIKNIQEEDKVEIFGVAGPSIYEGWFMSYKEAYEVFVKKVVPKIEKEMHVDDQVGIVSKRVPESQVKEYVQ